MKTNIESSEERSFDPSWLPSCDDDDEAATEDLIAIMSRKEDEDKIAVVTTQNVPSISS